MSIYPKNGAWTQSNRNKYAGSLVSTFNCDLDTQPGSILAGKRLVLNVNSSTLTNLGTPAAFAYFVIPDGSQFWTVAGSRVFTSNGGPETAFTQVGGDAPTDCNSNQSDIKVWEGNMFVTRASTSVSYLDSTGVWDDFTAGASSSGIRKLVIHGATSRMYMTHSNGSEVISWDAARTVATTGSQYAVEVCDGVSEAITTMESNSNRIWIGVTNYSGGKGYIAAWNGEQLSGVNEKYFLDNAGVLAMVVKDDVPYAIDTRGRLLAFNGATFIEIDRFPFYGDRPKSEGSTAQAVFMHYNGMSIVNGNIHALITAETWGATNDTPETCHSGIWEYTQSTGFNHKYAPTLSTAAGTITDFGQITIDRPGALFFNDVINANIDQDTANGDILAGFRYFTDATTAVYGIFYNDTNDTLQKRMTFNTPWERTGNLLESWNFAYLFHKPFLDASDKVVAKYRTREYDPLVATITWTGNSSFSTTDDISDFEVGDEIEVIRGTGGGVCAHITSLQVISGVTYCDIDEICPANSGTAKVRLQKWIKIGTVDDDTDYECLAIDGEAAKQAQFRFHAVFTGKDEINGITTTSQPHTKYQ